jgi:hypothetical protein
VNSHRFRKAGTKKRGVSTRDAGQRGRVALSLAVFVFGLRDLQAGILFQRDD